MSRIDDLLAEEDTRLEELRQRVQAVRPYEPTPDEPDYLTPDQIAWIRAELED